MGYTFNRTNMLFLQQLPLTHLAVVPRSQPLIFQVLFLVHQMPPLILFFKEHGVLHLLFKEILSIWVGNISNAHSFVFEQKFNGDNRIFIHLQIIHKVKQFLFQFLKWLVGLRYTILRYDFHVLKLTATSHGLQIVHKPNNRKLFDIRKFLGETVFFSIKFE